MKKASDEEPIMCSGCELCRDGKIPEFRDEEEMASFWRHHSPLDFPGEFEDIEVKVRDLRQKKVPVSIRLDPSLKEGVKKMARLKKVKYQALMQEWIRERLKEEEEGLIKRTIKKKAI
ncbi:MAG: CopG family antitoxin [Candidatus Eremiobacteraeota bacterium]|nr:CopG family antitoxin [Candidatus Eremiobacteraeota bacterium]